MEWLQSDSGSALRGSSRAADAQDGLQMAAAGCASCGAQPHWKGCPEVASKNK